jgi:hypothetical protein
MVNAEILETKDFDIAPINLRKGDTLTLTHTDIDAETTKHLIEHSIEGDLRVNRVSIVKIKDDLGFKTAIGAVFGEKA